MWALAVQRSARRSEPTLPHKRVTSWYVIFSRFCIPSIHRNKVRLDAQRPPAAAEGALRLGKTNRTRERVSRHARLASAPRFFRLRAR